MTRFFLLTSLLLFYGFCARGEKKQVNADAPLTPKPTTREAPTSVKREVDSIGNTIGLIVLNKRGYGKSDFIHFYNGDGSLWYKFSFYYDESDGKFEYANQDFRPFAFHADYFVLALRCVGKERGRYEVIVNEETGLRKYVKADDSVLKLETWEEHILNVSFVSFDQAGNPLLEVPRGRVKKAALSGASFQPVDVRGEWLKVKWDANFEDNRKEPKYDSGWIKWKEGERLLVEWFYFA